MSEAKLNEPSMPCGCPSATIPTTLELEGLEGPEAVQGYTCKCGHSFYSEPRSPNSEGGPNSERKE